MALPSPASSSRPGKPGSAGRLLARSWGLAARVFATLSRQGSRTPTTSSDDSLAIYAPEAGVRVALVTLLGLDQDDRNAALAAAMVTLGRTHRIVCVTDASPFDDLRRSGALVEHVPARDDQLRHAPELQWSDHLRDRYDLLVAKWRPAVVLAYGDSFDRVIDLAKAYENTRHDQRHA